MRRHLPNTINHTDCTRPLSGVGRNRYLRLVPGGGATAGDRVLCNMAFRFRHDYHNTFHVSIQDRKSYCFSNVKHGPDAMDQSRPNGTPSRRTIRCGEFLCAWLDFRDATMPRKIANPAFRRQLINPARKVCLSKSGLTVMCRNVCAAPMGGRVSDQLRGRSLFLLWEKGVLGW